MKEITKFNKPTNPVKVLMLGFKLIGVAVGYMLSKLFRFVADRLHTSYVRTTGMLGLFVFIFIWASNPHKTTTVTFERVSLIDTVVVEKSNDSVEILQKQLYTVLEEFEKTEAELLRVKKNIENTPSIVVADTKTSSKESYFAYWMWYLKSREGFVPVAYPCPAGYTTIGYGHNLESHSKDCTCKKYINSKGEISYSGATQLLVEDAERHLKLVMKQYPKLNRHQALAVTALAMNIGFAKVKKNAINERILAGKDPLFHKYNGYFAKKKNSKEPEWVVSPNLVRSRKFDAAMYKGDLNEIRNLTEKYGYKNNVVKNQLLPAKKRGNL